MPSTPTSDDRCASAVSYRATQPAGEVPLCCPDRLAGLFVQLDRKIGDAEGGDVGGHVELASAYDAEVDHALARGGMEATVGWGEAGVLKCVR